ncbi:hypothetical protein TWF730_005289 [Orbilia blumenaviensis]|uniref:Uncharacterized protein n=1 Tax=Orbilia blumenaviensis TaxID=1796055 RepID=A0AAV9VKC5_9PEZI
MASYIDIHKEAPTHPSESEPLNLDAFPSPSSSPANSRPSSPRPPPLSPHNPRTPLEPFEIMDTPLLDTHPKPPTIYTSRHRRTVLLCILLEVFIIFSFATTSLPFTRIVENAVCQRWYEYNDSNKTLAAVGRDGSGGGMGMADEKMCKTDEIQAGVVEILGVSDTVSTVVSLLVMFPSGFLAGVIDRRAFLLLAIGETAVGLSLMGFIGSHPLTFDPRLFWVIPLFDLLGGGFTFFGIMMRTVIAENTPKDDLAAVYYKLTGFNILSTFLGTTLGSWLMGLISPVTVLYMGVFLFVVLSVPTILLIPPAVKDKKSMYDDIRSSSQYPDTAADDDDDEDITAAPRRKATLYQRFLEQARSKTNLYASVKTLLFEQRAIRNALVILFLNMIARGVRIPFQTWVSKRYSWTLSKTGIVLSFESLMGAVVLLLLPFAKTRIERVVSGKGSIWRMLRFPADLMIATLSLVAQTLSALILTATASEFFLVTSLVVNAPARAFFDGLRSHCIAQAKESEIMIIHMAFVIVEIMSGILNGPLWIKVYAFTYSEGNMTGLGMGLPFAMCAVLTGVIVAGMGWARGYYIPTYLLTIVQNTFYLILEVTNWKGEDNTYMRYQSPPSPGFWSSLASSLGLSASPPPHSSSYYNYNRRRDNNSATDTTTATSTTTTTTTGASANYNTNSLYYSTDSGSSSSRPRTRDSASASDLTSSFSSSSSSLTMRYTNEDRLRREQPNPQLPGEVPSKRPQCYCPPYPHRNPSHIPGSTFKLTKYFTKYLFGADSDSEEDDYDDAGNYISRPTLNSPKLFESLPVEILGQILDDVVSHSTASDALCRCFYPGVKVAELKKRYLRWKLADTRNVRETCSRWHSWASRECFSATRNGIVVDFSDIERLRLRLEAYNKEHGDEEDIRQGLVASSSSSAARKKKRGDEGTATAVREYGRHLTPHGGPMGGRAGSGAGSGSGSGSGTVGGGSGGGGGRREGDRIHAHSDDDVAFTEDHSEGGTRASYQRRRRYNNNNNRPNTADNNNNDNDYNNDHDHDHDHDHDYDNDSTIYPPNGRSSSSNRSGQKKGISSFLSYYLLPEAAESKESFMSDHSHHIREDVDWSIIHKEFLTAFPYLRSGGVTLHLGSPMHIRNLESVYAMLSTFAVVWGGSLLRNGGGIVFWDFTYAWREDTDVFERLMNDAELGKERFLKYYDNPEREYWGIDEANWIMNPYQRPSMARIQTNRIQQRFALSRRVHEFIIEQTIAIIKSDAELVLDIITAAAGSSRIQVPVNIIAVLPPSKWGSLKTALQACKTVEFRDWLYCNEQQFSRLATQLAELEHPSVSRQVWWDALDVTSRALNLEVDLLIEKMHDEFNRLELEKGLWNVPETQVKDIEVRGRGWMRSSHYAGGFVGKGHERRWFGEGFVRKFVFGQGSAGVDRQAESRGIEGIEKFLLADGCWAAEVSLGASLVLLQKSFSAHTLRTLRYAPAIPQLSMSSRAPVQPHACPLLSMFPNLTDAFVYSVCCPEIFRAFLSSSSAPAYLGKLMATADSTPEFKLPSYDKNLKRKWTIVVPRVHKSIARGCRDYAVETTSHLAGPSDAAQQEVHAEYLLKTPAWGLVWNRESLTDLLSAARQAADVLVNKQPVIHPTPPLALLSGEKRGGWDLRIVFEGMVAVESLDYASGVNMPKYLGFESYDNLFFGSRSRYPHGSLDIKETVFYPLREPASVEVVAKVLHSGYLRTDESEDDDDDEEYEGEERRRGVDDGIRRAWMEEEDFLGGEVEE